MTDSEAVLRNALRDAQANATGRPVPDFDDVWAAANIRVEASRRRHRVFTGSVAVAAVVALAFGLGVLPEAERPYIDADELLETTGWSAPSDSLMPLHRVDLYRDIPVFMESTDSYGGSLL